MKDRITFLVCESNRLVSAGESMTVCARPQTQILKPFKCYIPPWIAERFTIQDIRVGCQSMFPAMQNLDAMQFSHGDGHEMEIEPIMCSQDFIMMVTNVGGYPSTFRAAWSCRLPRALPQPSSPRRQVFPDPVYQDTDGLGDIKSEEEIREFKTSGKVYVEKDPHLRHVKHHPGFGWDPGYGDD